MAFAYTVTGGYPPYKFDLVGGALPPGVTLNADTGALEGTPTQMGTFSFTIRVQDKLGQSDTINSSIKINEPVPMEISGKAPVLVQGNDFTYQYEIRGGSPPYTVQITDGYFPEDLVLDDTGKLSGKVTGFVGFYPVTFKATDSLGTELTHTDELQVMLPDYYTSAHWRVRMLSRMPAISGDAADVAGFQGGGGGYRDPDGNILIPASTSGNGTFAGTRESFYSTNSDDFAAWHVNSDGSFPGPIDVILHYNAPVSAKTVSFSAGVNPYYGRNPTKFEVAISNTGGADDSEWTTIKTFDNLSWASGETKVFDL